MVQAKKGDKVKVNYTGKLEDGTVFDSSNERGPLELTLGAGEILPAFEEAVEGLEPGQATETTIPADQAYGPRQEEAVINVPRTELPEDLNPEMGQRLQVETEGGQAVPVTVTDLNDESVTLDANHPLAGKDLAFDIELVEIVQA